MEGIVKGGKALSSSGGAYPKARTFVQFAENLLGLGDFAIPAIDSLGRHTVHRNETDTFIDNLKGMIRKGRETASDYWYIVSGEAVFFQGGGRSIQDFFDHFTPQICTPFIVTLNVEGTERARIRLGGPISSGLLGTGCWRDSAGTLRADGLLIPFGPFQLEFSITFYSLE